MEADQLLYLNDALLISNNLLPLLQTKVGFWSNFEFTDDALRLVCDVFDLVVRKKGSRDGIVQSIQVFLRTLGLTTDFDIFIQNRDAQGNDVYYIEIGINATWHDTTLLREILRYILPTGYILRIYFYDLLKFIDKSLLYSDFVLTTSATTYNASKVRNEYYSSTTDQWKVLGARLIYSDAILDEHYNGIQSLDLTRIYDGSIPESILYAGTSARYPHEDAQDDGNVVIDELLNQDGLHQYVYSDTNHGNISVDEEKVDTDALDAF